MDLEAVVLLAWVVVLFGAVCGVFWGVFKWPLRAAGWLGWARRPSTWLADNRVLVLLGVIGAGVVFGTISASATLGGTTPGQTTGPGQDYGQSNVGRGVDMLYEGMRELTGQASPQPGNPLFSRMARAAWPAMILLLALEVIVKLFHEPVLRLRLRSCHDHVVICGLGRIGRELTTACCRDGIRVVVVESDPQNPAIAAATEAGALVWIGDLTSKSVLRLVRAARARHIFFVSGSDEQNLEAVSDLLLVLLEPPRNKAAGRTPPPKITIHLDRPELNQLLIYMKHRLNESAEVVKRWVSGSAKDPSRCAAKLKEVDKAHARLARDGIDLRAFNMADQAIHDLFDAYILDRRPPRVPGAGDTVAHFVILGFGPIGQRLALHLARQAHFENHRRARMTIVHTPEDSHCVERFRRDFPALFPTRSSLAEEGEAFDGYDPEHEYNAWRPDGRLDDWGFGVHVADVLRPTDKDRGVSFVCNGGFVEHAGGPLSPAVIDQLVRLAGDTSVRPMVFICDVDDANNCSQGVLLREELDLRLKQRGQPAPGQEQTITIFPNVPSRPMLTKLTSPNDPKRADLIPFGDAAVSCTYEKLVGDPITCIAHSIQHDFFELHPSPGVETPSWESLAVWERSSNLAAAFHINAKLAVLGLRLVPRGSSAVMSAKIPTADSVPQDLRETIAMMEHNRWMAERLLAGWSLGVRAKPENKRRHQFVPWEMLTENSEREKDHSQVAVALRVCQGLVEGPDGEFVVVRV